MTPGAGADLHRGRGLVVGSVFLALVSSVLAVGIVFAAIERGHTVEAASEEAAAARFLAARNTLLAAIDREHGLLELLVIESGAAPADLANEHAAARTERRAIQADTYLEVADLSEGTSQGAVIADTWLVAVSPVEIGTDVSAVEILRRLERLRLLVLDAGGAGDIGSTPELALLVDQSRRPVVWDLTEALFAEEPLSLPDPSRFLPVAPLTDRVPAAAVAVDDLLESAEWASMVDLAVAGEPPTPSELAVLFGALHDDLAATSELLHDNAVVSAEARASRTALSALLATVMAAAVLLVGVGGAAVLVRRRRRLDDLLVALARTDPLTRLRNRLALTTEFAPTLANPRRAGHALLHLDLDRFKAVNDTYGHKVGDQVLTVFARRLTEAVGEQAAGLARVGGDEFVVVLHDLSHPEGSAQQLGTRILEHMGAPVRVGERNIDVGVSIGMAVANEGIELEDLLLEADIALYRAKEAGRGRTWLFDQVDERDLIRELDHVFDAGEIRVDLQPQVEIATHEIVGVEVLARWEREDGSILPARDWIGTLEWLGESHRLLEVVASAAARAADTVGEAWQGRFWLNLAASDLNGLDAADALISRLEATGLPLERFGVEMDETADVVDIDHVAEVLGQVRARGVNIAIDNFGRGNSPLQHLTLLPLDCVKLDHSVITNIETDERQRALVAAMADICSTLSIDLIAEGVENGSELALLSDYGIRYAQGHATGRPLSPQQLGRSVLPPVTKDDRPRLDPHRI
ncbi:MAG: EAL domain-containing protein [Actinomycetia bacterium]|nr:EAL domain-containing protein [Actinomycetes bacterium]MCP4085252.1 EAL domain-containing protein [Actinomycetes bacterium]